MTGSLISSRHAMALSHSLVLLLAFGFFKELKPSEPFLTPYLVDDKHISNNQVSLRERWESAH
jgi:hypothetical protein